ncbi:MAG TPA: hypothetical protein VMT53_22700 [Terriglobales bacterium]|nr:hypothetical protein [Terriglobales bacterium]
MKLLTTFLAFCAVSTWAQATSAPLVIKSEGCVGVVFLQFSPDGTELARECGFAPIQLFDTATYRKSRTFRPEIDYTPELTGFDYSPDGKTMATARNHSGALIWKADDPGKPVPHDGQTLKSFYGVDEVYALDKPLHVLQGPNPRGDDFASVLSINYSPDGKLLLTKHQSGQVKIWNAFTWELQSELTVSEKGNKALFSSLAIAPDSKSFVIGDQNGLLHIWSIESKSEIRAVRSLDGSGKIVANLVFSPDGKTLVAIHQGKRFNDGVAVLWNTTGWSAHSMSGYSSAAFSRDGQLLAVGGPDIRLFDPSGKEVNAINIPAFTRGEVLPGSAGRPDAGEKIPCGVSALAFSPDGATLAVGCFEGTLRIVGLSSH